MICFLEQECKKIFLEDSADKTLLISGAGGSIGSEIARQLLIVIPRQLFFLISQSKFIFIERECQAIKLSKELKTKIIPILEILEITEKFPF